MRQRGFSIASLLKAGTKSEAQGRLGQRVPVAIIDIGSNSVRQVVYEGLTRSPSVLFNEKVLCGLGTGVAKTGLLDKTATARALLAIARFVKLGEQLGVGETHVLATAATREAKNGAEFVAKIEEITGQKIKILSGRMEAELAAYGIKSGFYKPEGIAGDLGGGSMELIEVNGNHANGVTTPLGSLKLKETSNGEIVSAQKQARKVIENISLQWPGKSRIFYAIGGTWRALARLHMLETGHQMDVVHGYSVPAEEFTKFCLQVAYEPLDQFSNIEEISKTRRNLLPYGAIVLAETLTHLNAETVSTSAVGLREGYLYSLLDDEIREQDALLEATAELSILRARSPAHCRELADWTEEALKAIGLEENRHQRRWRIAACNLADIAWRAASDFRSEQTLGIITNAGFNSISHEGRAFLALVAFHRYQGLGPKKEPPQSSILLNEESRKLGRILAALFRVAYLFSGAVEGVLPHIHLRRTDSERLILEIPLSLSDMVGEKPEQRVEALSKELNEPVELITSK